MYRGLRDWQHDQLGHGPCSGGCHGVFSSCWSRAVFACLCRVIRGLHDCLHDQLGHRPCSGGCHGLESSLHVGPELSLHAYVVLFVVCVTGSMTSWDTDPAVVVVTESSLHVGPELSVQADVG